MFVSTPESLRLPGFLALLALLSPFALIGCSDGSDRPAKIDLLPIAVPTVSSPPPEGEPSLLSSTFALSDVGYAQQEFFITGTASSFTNLNELGSDGMWNVEPGEEAEYRTRVLMYTPVDAASFSGSVYVEWLNVTTGFELPVSYGTAHTQLLREGHAIALVSAQYVGVEGAENPLLPLHLKAVNPARYGTLNHPGDSFSYDIFTQVAGLLSQTDNNELLDGESASLIIAMGQSQSASHLVTYFNAIQPVYKAFDGFLIQNRGAGSSSLAQQPLTDIPTPRPVYLRSDSTTVVINVQGESDILGRDGENSRQDDNDNFRLWEIAGSAHNDEYTFVSGRNDIGDDPRFATVVEQTSILGFQECNLPMNSGYLAWPLNAAIHALDRWARGGEPPAEVARLDLDSSGLNFLLDDVGNVTGGVRTSYVEAPAAVLSGLGQEGNDFCFLFGTTKLFDKATMAARYIDSAGYKTAVSNSVATGIEQGTLLQSDAQRIIDATDLQWEMLEF
ncbi:MAG: alpha/beta hydrolase domain-containing protein [Halioglobus sp.]